MNVYKNLAGDSSIEYYKISMDYIEVKFKNSPRIYVYSSSRVGKENLELMKQLAIEGNGLNAFINKYVGDLYDR